MKYRVEQKYIITEEKVAYLKFKLENIMQYDKYAKDGIYRIRSLYFDDYYEGIIWHSNNLLTIIARKILFVNIIFEYLYINNKKSKKNQKNAKNYCKMEKGVL